MTSTSGIAILEKLFNRKRQRKRRESITLSHEQFRVKHTKLPYVSSHDVCVWGIEREKEKEFLSKCVCVCYTKSVLMYVGVWAK